MLFSEWLREWLKGQIPKRTHRKFANKAGVSLSALNSFLGGARSSMRLETVDKIVTALGNGKVMPDIPDSSTLKPSNGGDVPTEDRVKPCPPHVKPLYDLICTVQRDSVGEVYTILQAVIDVCHGRSEARDRETTTARAADESS